MSQISRPRNNAGQIKLNWADPLDRPTTGPGIVANTIHPIPLNNLYTVSGFPTTTYPALADPASAGENTIDPVTLLLREIKAGQICRFRTNLEYINKGGTANWFLQVFMFNPNPASTFRLARTMPTPGSANNLIETFDFTAIADGLSLDPLFGYSFECRMSNSDANMEVRIVDITAIYQAVAPF